MVVVVGARLTVAAARFGERPSLLVSATTTAAPANTDTAASVTAMLRPRVIRTSSPSNTLTVHRLYERTRQTFDIVRAAIAERSNARVERRSPISRGRPHPRRFEGASDDLIREISDHVDEFNAARPPLRPPSPAAWAPDPFARHELTYADGTRWTEHVRRRRHGHRPAGRARAAVARRELLTAVVR
jgi:hypothetical protein